MVPTTNEAPGESWQPGQYAATLRTKGAVSAQSTFRTNDPEEAARAALFHWMLDPHSDIATATAIEIRPYNSMGGVDDTIVLTVDAQSIQEKLKFFAPRAIAAAGIEDRRTAAAALLSTVTIRDAAALTRIAEEFRTHHAQYPDTCGLAHPNGFRDVTGPGRLEFLKFGREAAMALGHAGNDGWQYWLDIVDGYLLQDDRDEECMGKWQAASSAGAPERGAVHGEMFVVHQLFRGAALCASWLLSTAPREQPGSDVAPVASTSTAGSPEARADRDPEELTPTEKTKRGPQADIETQRRTSEILDKFPTWKTDIDEACEKLDNPPDGGVPAKVSAAWLKKKIQNFKGALNLLDEKSIIKAIKRNERLGRALIAKDQQHEEPAFSQIGTPGKIQK